MIAGAAQLTVALAQQVAQTLSLLQSAAEKRAAEPVQRRMSRVKNNQAARGEQALEKAAKGFRVGRARRVATEKVLHFRAWLRRPQTHRLPAQSVNRARERNLPHGGAFARRGVIAQGQALTLRGEEGGVVDLLEVVILARQPEDGNGRRSFPRQFFGQVNGRERLVDTVGRPTEKSHLLTGDDGHGLGVAEASNVLL